MMRKLATLTGAALIGVGILTASAWAEQGLPTQHPSQQTAPSEDSPSDRTRGPREAEVEAESKGGSTPAPGPAGCPLFDRKLELIV